VLVKSFCGLEVRFTIYPVPGPRGPPDGTPGRLSQDRCPSPKVSVNSRTPRTVPSVSQTTRTHNNRGAAGVGRYRIFAKHWPLQILRQVRPVVVGGADGAVQPVSTALPREGKNSVIISLQAGQSIPNSDPSKRRPKLWQTLLTE